MLLAQARPMMPCIYTSYNYKYTVSGQPNLKIVYYGIQWYTVVYMYYRYTMVYYSIHRTVYLDDSLWVWQYQSEHSGGSSKQHHDMSTPDLLYTDIWQHRPHTSQEQLESIVREVCV